MSFSDSAKQVIGTIAPILGTALGGPLGALAGGLLAKALGKDGTPATSAEIEKALAAQDPATMLALKQVEADLQKHMADLGVQEDQLAYADVDSARKREAAVKDNTPEMLIYLLTAGFFGLIGALLYVNIPEANKPVLYALVGTLGTAWTMGIGYFYGTSKGSGAKTDGILDALAKK